MSGLTAQAESDTITDIVFGGTGDVYLALHTSDPGNSPDGTTEVSDTNYSRVQVQESDFTETGDGPTTLTNDVEISFDPFDANVGDITHGSFADSGTQGTADFQVVGSLSPVRNFSAGEFPNFQSGEITFEID
ncbi:MAG TPA: hypothetical protein VKP88_04535 [Candidatus Paceibacterota bacterium]|nr:hypothetical protein [Candidatus Paceibacterota bacterium]